MADKTRPAKKRKLDFSDEHKIIVGPKEAQKTYTVAKHVLTKSSEFFKRACNGSWKEGKTRTIELLEADPAIFEIYLQLLYTGEVVTLEEDVPSWSDTSDPATTDVHTRHTEAIIKTYLLADMLMDIKLKNILADTFIKDDKRCVPAMKLVALVFSNTTSASPLRRLLVDTATCDGVRPYYERWLAHYPHQFVVDLALANMALVEAGKPAVAPRKAGLCTYHEHDDANPKCE